MTPHAELLHTWLRRQLSEEARGWLEEALESLRRSPSDRTLFLALGLVPRRVGKDDLALSPADLQAASAARAGWNPGGWSTDQAARLLLLLSDSADDSGRFAQRLEQLFRTADVGEAITLYRGLPLYPAPELHLARAREGVRTNMKAVFEAVAHDNPYPCEQFGEDAWNQMI
ncbi:MAG: EboA domain-containing protein, partial [Gammaproteobacteria bacterium]